MQTAIRHDGRNLARQEAEGAGRDGKIGPIDLVQIQVSNRRIEGLLDDLQEIDDLRITLLPTGVMALHPPQESAADQVTDVTARSPMEVFLAGLMSVGSWTGLIGYSLAGGLVVWNGLYANTIFLLVAAMLIAPFAGPAMTLALATARGDVELLGRSVLRYVTSIGVAVATAYVTSLLLNQQVATDLMIERSLISEVTIILPIVAGAAGALNLVQSEHSNLVSGAATGMLVAASLAPPAGVVGMSAAIGDWPMAKSGLFLLVLQLVGINLSGALVFRLYGLTPRGARYARGRWPVAWLGWIASALLVAGLLWWQFTSPPDLQRSTRQQRAIAAIQQAMDGHDGAQLVQAQANFTRSDIHGQNTLYIRLIAQRPRDARISEPEQKQQLTHLVQQTLLQEGFNVTPLVEVTLLEPPADAGTSSMTPTTRP